MADAERDLDRLREGEDRTPVGAGMWPTPGQWIAAWNDMTAQERLACAADIVDLYQQRHDRLLRPARSGPSPCCCGD